MNRTPVTVLTLLIASILLLTGCQSTDNKTYEEHQDKRAEAYYRLGLDALRKNQLPKAFEELMKAEKADPHHVGALDALGYAWRLHGNFEKSEFYYRRAIRFGAGSATYNNYGHLLLKLKRFDEAKVQLEKALEDPRYRNQYKARINLGDALVGLKQYDEAISVYQNASRFGSRQMLSRIKEARAYVASDRLNYAQALYEAMLREEPKNRAVMEGLLEVLKLRKEYSVARTRLAEFGNQTTSELDRAWAADELDKLR